MSFFDKITEKLFSKKPGATTQVHEVMQRSEKEQQAYERWKQSEEKKLLLRKMAQAYYYKKTNIRSEMNVHILNMPSANGFAISYHPNISAKHFQYMLDYLKDRVLLLDYRLVNTDRRMIEKKNYVETTEHYYLKPPLDVEGVANEPVDQRFGNVSVAQVFVDDRPSYLKVLVSTYSDRLYQDALHFDDFVTHLFEEEE
uniref:Uncharacterized protein n=1 Tax=Roseihalotalea indica TaxID=2867963 RepID=A0AA49GQ11_9BACT|nr:hypothetical protein K4G66_03900 [Tunicatimonas sp. TK19036]